MFSEDVAEKVKYSFLQKTQITFSAVTPEKIWEISREHDTGNLQIIQFLRPRTNQGLI